MMGTLLQLHMDKDEDFTKKRGEMIKEVRNAAQLEFVQYTD